MDKTQATALKKLLKAAKNCGLQGRYYVFEVYKQQLEALDLSSSEYQQACRKLADALQV